MKNLLAKEWFRKLRIDASGGDRSKELPSGKRKERQAEAQKLLAEDPGMSNAAVAARLGVDPSTVGRWTFVKTLRAEQAKARKDRPKGFKGADGQMESWREVLDPGEVDKYDPEDLK